jgi:hypothetical protein
VTSKQIDRLLDIFSRAVKVAEQWADREYPVVDETEATISRVGERPLAQSVREYNELEPEETVGRFEQKFRAKS